MSICRELTTKPFLMRQSSVTQYWRTYWGDDVTIYQLVITTSFHFSLLSLIARHITIVTPESTIQSYQYITTVTLFTRTQSSTLGPRCVISCSDLFTYLLSLRHSVLDDLSIIIISSLSQRSLLPCCYPGGNNLQYIYYSVLASLLLVTRIWTMKVC